MLNMILKSRLGYLTKDLRHRESAKVLKYHLRNYTPIMQHLT